jgi:hypothetical protein
VEFESVSLITTILQDAGRAQPVPATSTKIWLRLRCELTVEKVRPQTEQDLTEACVDLSNRGASDGIGIAWN